ncbi:MAG: glucosaminidase domain-containing protein [Pseudomonadota bacterium]
MSTIHDPSLVNDFGSLTRLKAQAARDPQAQARIVAGQFEALFIQQMIKTMRAASPGDPLMDGAGVQMFRDMQDQQLASGMAKSGGVGLSDFILRQLTPQGGRSTKILPPKPDGFPSLDLKKLRDKNPQAETPASAEEAGPAKETREITARRAEGGPLPAVAESVPGFTDLSGTDRKSPQGDPAGGRPGMVGIRPAGDATRPNAIPSGVALAFRSLPRNLASGDGGRQGGDARVRWEEPGQFVQDLMPHARAAAARLGVDPQVLVAQSALETGWGRHLPSDGEGRPSMNLFGIKAHGGWSGERTVASTLEYEGGAMVRKSEAFRAYGSIRAAFDDYVSFLQSNPRYTEALRHAGDSERFVQELQKAGYATDPRYADKILSILRDSPLNEMG